MKIRIEENGKTKEVDIYSDEGFDLIAELWTKTSCYHRIMYEPIWMGIPIIQFPGDIIMMQELIWKVRPDVIVETGVAHGGTAIFYASMLELLGRGTVIGIDVEIRQYNKIAIKGHPLSKRIQLIKGSSIDEAVVKQVKKIIRKGDKVLVALDSNHSYDHVFAEMRLYSDLISPDSYMVVMDGAQALAWDLPNGKHQWKEDNPLRAIEEFVTTHPEFEVDHYYNRLKITSNPKAFLRRLTAEEMEISEQKG